LPSLFYLLTALPPSIFYALSLHDALPIYIAGLCPRRAGCSQPERTAVGHVLFRSALVPGVAGVLLGYAQFWREARDAYFGRSHAGYGVLAGRIGGATACRRRRGSCTTDPTSENAITSMTSPKV